MQQPYHPPDPNLSNDAEIARQIANRIIREGNEAEQQRERARRSREEANKSPAARASERKTAFLILPVVISLLLYWYLDTQGAVPRGQETLYGASIYGAVLVAFFLLTLAMRLLELVFQGIGWLVNRVVFPLAGLALLLWLGATALGL